MTRPLATVILMAGLHGLLITSALAPFDLPLTAWLGLWPLFWLAHRFRYSIGWLLLSGLTAALFTNLLAFFWIFDYLDTLRGIGPLQGLLIFVTYALLATLKTPLFVVLFGISLRPRIRAWLPAASFSAAGIAMLSDYLAPQVYPWHWGNLLSGNVHLAQLAEYSGVHGLSLLLFVGSYWLYRMLTTILPRLRSPASARSLHRLFRRRRLWLLPLAFLLLFALGLGLRLQAEALTRAMPTVRVATLQPNSPLELTGVDAIPKTVVDTIVKHTIPDLAARVARDAADGLDLIVLPESAVPYYSADPGSVTARDNIYSADFETLARRLAYQLNANVLLNEIVLRADEANGPDQYFNAVVLYARNGTRQDNYRKRQLIAFGEYLPLNDLVRKLGLMPLVPEDLRSEFTRGGSHSLIGYDIEARKSALAIARQAPTQALADPAPGVLAQRLAERPPFQAQGHFLPLICYEVLFPAHIRQFFAGPDNPDFMVNVTQDGWFGDSMESMQHFELGRMRAIEFRRALVRATNSGVSGLVDPTGHYATPLAGPLFSPQGETAHQVWDVPINRAPPTFYARFGEGWIMALLVLFLLAVFRRLFRATR